MCAYMCVCLCVFISLIEFYIYNIWIFYNFVFVINLSFTIELAKSSKTYQYIGICVVLAQKNWLVLVRLYHSKSNIHKWWNCIKCLYLYLIWHIKSFTKTKSSEFLKFIISISADDIGGIFTHSIYWKWKLFFSSAS